MTVDDLAHDLDITDSGTTRPPAQIERLFGTRLPGDYLAFVARFPPGEFGNEVRVLHPDLWEQERANIQDLVAFFKDQATTAPFEFGTDTEQLVVWGTLNTVALLTWRITSGEPEEWPVVVVTENGDWREFGMNMVDFLRTVVMQPAPVMVGYVPLNSERPEYLLFGSASEYVPTEYPIGDWQSAGAESVVPRDDVDGIVTLLPDTPQATQTTNWDAVAAELGHPIPRDFRHLIDRIGAGRYGRVDVMAPTRLGWLQNKVYTHAVSRRRSGDSMANLPIRPETNGAIPWAEAADGWVLVWLPINENPNRWPVAAIDPTWLAARIFDVGLSGFLLRYFRDPSATRAWPPQADDRPSFTPYTSTTLT